MSHGHAHDSDLKQPLVDKTKDEGGDPSLEKEVSQLTTATYVSLLLMCIEVAGGYMANSLAIMTDAMHLLSDVGGFIISVFTLKLMMKKPDAKHSFGFQQVGVLGALVSVSTIWLMAGGLFVTGIQRIVSPEPIDGKLMSIIACLGFLANVTMMAILGHDHGGAGCDHGHAHGGEDGHQAHGGGHEEHGSGHQEHGGGHQEHGGGHQEHGGGHQEHGAGHQEHGAAHQEHGAAHQEHGAAHQEHGAGHQEHGAGHQEHGGHEGHGGHDVEAGGCCGGHDSGHAEHGGHGGHGDHGGQNGGHEEPHAAPKRSLAMDAAVIHVIGDMVQSIGVMIAGICIWLQPFDVGESIIVIADPNSTDVGATTSILVSNWVYADPICTILFTILVIGTTIGTVRQVVSQILMSFPPNLDSKKLKDALQSVDGVTDMHDLHVWMVGQGVFLTAHVEVEREEQLSSALTALVSVAQKKFQIGHATFQLEVKGKFHREAEHLLLGGVACQH